MKRYGLVLILLLMAFVPLKAQQVIYANLKELLTQQGDTVSTLLVEQRTANQRYFMIGGEYKISVPNNKGLSRYIRARAYAVQVDDAFYVNCRKMRYKKYRFGQWYAPAMWVDGKIFYSAQPLGQEAASTLPRKNTEKLNGEVGNAIDASGLVFDRVYYELDPETGKSEFVGKERMAQLLQGRDELIKELEAEPNESAEIIVKYLRQLQK